MWMHGFGGMGGVMGFGLVLWLAVIGGVVALVVWALRRPGATGGADTEADAMDILNRRYACGELTRDQFEQMKRDLS